MLPTPDPSELVDLSPNELAFLESLRIQLQAADLERRAHDRRELGVEIHLSTIDGKPLIGHTLDLSRGGVRAVFDRPPSLGMHYAVCLFGLEERPTRALGRCLRIALVKDGGCEAVLQFATPLPECSSLD